MSLLLAVLMQVGPFSSPDARPISPLPPELQNRAAHRPSTSTSSPLPPQRSERSGESLECGEAIKADAAAAASAAQAALDGLEADKARGDDAAKTSRKAAAGQCLGMALSELGRWDDAVAAFRAAHDLVQTDALWSARLGAMQGIAALQGGHADNAVTVLEAAAADARRGSAASMAGDIQIDQARALLKLGKLDEAAAVLAAARAASPANADGWLGSATLARRQNRLAEAQQLIEHAGALQPRDPAIGLEAGVIAVLSGHDDAARKSWQSVLTTAPGTPEADQARAYIAQLGPEAAAPVVGK